MLRMYVAFLVLNIWSLAHSNRKRAKALEFEEKRHE